jgi:two-component system response regulator HydG
LLRFARELGRPTRRFSPEALDRLGGYHWPGNIRELENLVQRAVILCQGEQVEAGHLPPDLSPGINTTSAGAMPFPQDATLQQVERIWIDRVLASCGGNKSEAARRLGIDVSTLHRKLR